MVETFAEGWWYTAAVPRGGRVIACMTDADRVRLLGLSCGEGLERLLAETKHVQQVVDMSRPIDRPKIYPAGSRRLQSKTTLRLLCVGDAAMCSDPVSGQGIIKALRSGIFAAYAIGDFLGNGDVRGLSCYRLMLDREFGAYQKALPGYYTQERRWPNRPFWHRRTATAASSCDKTLEQKGLSTAREPQNS